ncbi:hypothetical protein FRC01_003678 [Tulasnella sp. 417]|nr:hypothetical protein FRC01_003678 [Tulasnella sp. 417]
MKSRRLEQTLFLHEDLPRSIAVEVCDNDEECDWEEALAELFVDQQWESQTDDDDDDESPPPIPIGFAPLFEAVESSSPSSPPQYYLCYLAFATATRVVVIPTPNPSTESCGYDKWSAVSNFTSGNAQTGTGRGYVLDLALLADIQHQYDLLEAANPQFTVTEYTEIEKDEFGQVIVKQAAFKNKARMGAAQNVVLRKGDAVVAEGYVSKTKGKQATIALRGEAEVDEESVNVIEVHGRSDFTKAEVARNAYLLLFLQGDDALGASAFIRKIWFPTPEDLEDLQAVKANVDNWVNDPENDPLAGTSLNTSQANVARAMLSDNSFALVHGPPGTGKTRTIAEVVKIWWQQGKTAYLVAQTNVGVKNIAEKLIKEEITDFRLLVSDEFYEEWHESQYNECKEYMIRSTFFRKSLKKEMRKMKFVLCTIGMLFSPALEKLGLFRTIPMERLVVDEASQIFVGDYLALFYKFRATLQKVCWFGDPRQLPPHQREQIQGLKSIYDIPHVKDASLMLDTQYRMPPEIGNFVSVVMYDRYLRSWSKHGVPGHDCIKFVDVAVGDEKEANTSWVNEAEADTILHLVRNYYADLPFVVITPYDSQRKLIEKKLDAEGLPGKGRCFNVDSFQGNEEDYVLISCVRTSRTGFLDLHNRINVMLTRAKRGMVIVTKREFARRIARNTLVGRLSQTWGKPIDLDDKFAEDDEDGSDKEGKSDSGDNSESDEQHGSYWVYYLDVRDKIGDMPGSRGYPRPISPPKPKAPEPPRVTAFHAVPVAPPRPMWSSKPKQASAPSSSPTVTTLKPASPPKPKWVSAPTSTPWGSGGPAIRTASSTPAGAWSSKPSIVASTTKSASQWAKPQPEPIGATWTFSGLPSQTGGNRSPGKKASPNRR